MAIPNSIHAQPQTGASGKFFSRLLDTSLSKRSKTAEIQAEVRRLIRREMIAAETPAPPVNLRRFAKHLGVQDIVSAPLAVRGRLILENGQLLVEVSDQLDELNQRITTAHELGHIILERERVALSKSVNANVRAAVSHRLIESLCDYSAHEILLPRWWIEENLLRMGRKFAAALEMSQSSGLPLDFVVVRLIELQFVQWRAVWCARSDQGIHVLRSIPTWNDAFLSRVVVSNDMGSPLRASWETSEVVSGHLEITIQGETTTFRAQCFRKDSTTSICVIYTGRD